MLARHIMIGLAFVLAVAGLAQAQYARGDTDCDGSINSLDIDPFVLALTSTPPGYPEYYAQYPGCDALLADINCDGSINSLDIDPFVQCLTGSCPACPTFIETVTIGNPGNSGELSGEGAGGYGLDRICGAVDYVYNIGKYEVTAGQYTEFLNAVAATDTYELYNTYMAVPSGGGCNIQRSGSYGSYKYSVAGDWAVRPVNYVNWGDAARFANWLHNGQPTGAQGLTTTEDGSYFLNGATTDAELSEITREPDATWVIPSEDEWYKAAYHKNDGVTGNYWDYPTSTNTVPSNDLIDPDPGNNATYYIVLNDYTIGSPYYRTEVGAHENSDSPYGTFDQGGNTHEWNDTIISGSYRGVRGGSCFVGDNSLHAAFRIDYDNPSWEYNDVGFRVAQVP